MFSEIYFEVVKLHFAEPGELSIVMSNGIMIILEILITKDEKKSCSFILNDFVAPDYCSMINSYQGMFEEFIPDNF